MAKRFKDVPNIPFAPVAAVLFALVVTALVFATPAWRLERLVTLTGLADVFSPARPPLGDTARALMAVTSGAMTFILLWVVLRPLEKFIHNRGKAPLSRSYTFGKKPGDAPAPMAAAGSASARRPIFTADDLGAPLMSDAALSSGEELFLDAAMIDAPAQIESEISAYPAYHAPTDDTPLMHGQELTSDFAPEPSAEPIVQLVPPPQEMPQETVIEWLTPESIDEAVPVTSYKPDAVREPVIEFAPEPATPLPAPTELIMPAAQQYQPTPEPTLRELLVKFETALKRREAAANQGRGPSAMMPETTAQSLRDLMASGRLR